MRSVHVQIRRTHFDGFNAIGGHGRHSSDPGSSAKLLAIGGSGVQRRARPALVTLPVVWAIKVELPFKPLDGRHVRLEPLVQELKAEVRGAIDCDPETWAIMPVNPMGGGFEKYWSAACGARRDERLV